jgi:hypothetical protein
LVASITASLRFFNRLPATSRTRSKASALTPWSVSSSDTKPRAQSDEITSVGRKCLAAKVDFPEPVEPISTIRAKSGISMSL